MNDQINATDSSLGSPYSPYKAKFCRYLVQEEVAKEIAALSPAVKEEFPKDGNKKTTHPESLKVGIVGAGIAGLYTALILDYLKIDFEILESSDRVGGRILTHYFTKDKPHQYYDIGAMRFPKVPTMDRTFNLFCRTGINKKLIDYYMKGENQPMRYNDITIVLPKDDPMKEDPFRVSTKNGGPVPPETVRDTSIIMNEAFDRFKNKIKRAVEEKDEEELKRAWEFLMRHDRFSLRDYLGFVEGQDPETIHWLETLDSATGWFDQAFTENVLETLAFDYGPISKPFKTQSNGQGSEKAINGKCGCSETDGNCCRFLIEGNWYCIDGGTEELTQTLGNQFANKITCGKRVAKMALDRDRLGRGEDPMAVYCSDKKSGKLGKPQYYSTIINTTTLAALQKVDLTGMELTYGMKAAIRSLRYDTSTKVGIRFRNPWWITKKGIKKAGLGKTDMPLRTCVYPSYNLHDHEEKDPDEDPAKPKDKPAVLLCSYTWGQDSERIAAYVKGNSAKAEDEPELKELMITNLAWLHTGPGESFEETYKMISDEYITHHAYDWSKDENSAGAFALFSASQFSQLYPHLVKPSSDSRFNIIGEAASAHHAWIVGALDSAVRGIYMMLERFGLHDLQKKLEMEFGCVEELDEATAKIQVELGRLKPKEPPKISLTSEMALRA